MSKYDFNWFGIRGLGEIHLIPTICFIYNKYSFFETGVYTPQFVLSIKFLSFQFGIDIQLDPHKI
jgi:hypothetical protein